MPLRIQSMSTSDIRARAAHARSFLALAEISHAGGDVGDANASASTSVAAGIAASDVIAGKRLGYCAKSQDHRDAEKVLRDAGAPSGIVAAFARLISSKSFVMYGTEHLSGTRTSDLLSYAQRMVDEMERVLG